MCVRLIKKTNGRSKFRETQRKKEKMKLRRRGLLIIDPITSSVSITICIAVWGMIR